MAFARLLVRDVQVVVLDEATVRMDPQTEQRVTRAAERLLQGRTGVVVAHRLSATQVRTVAALLLAYPRWGLAGALAFLAAVLLNAYGVVTGWLWGNLVAGLQAGSPRWDAAALLAAALLIVLVVSALASARGAPLAGSAARVAGDEQARLGRSLASVLDARADCVVVLEDGRVAATGRWTHLAERWDHLAG